MIKYMFFYEPLPFWHKLMSDKLPKFGSTYWPMKWTATLPWIQYKTDEYSLAEFIKNTQQNQIFMFERVKSEILRIENKKYYQNKLQQLKCINQKRQQNDNNWFIISGYNYLINEELQPLLLDYK